MKHSPLLPCVSVHRMRRCQGFTLAIAILTWLMSGQSAQALKFTFSFETDLSSEMREGLILAGERWESILTDDTTVNLDIAENPNLTRLASFSPSLVNVRYRDFATALERDNSLSPDDTTALSFLPQSHGFDILTNFAFDLLLNATKNHPSGTAGDVTPYIDADGDCNNRLVRLTTANARAIGLPASGTNSCAGGPQTIDRDGILSFNPNILWDFDPSDGIDPEHYDFVGAATQGLGVALGVRSGINVVDFNTSLPKEDPGSLDDHDTTVVAFDDNVFTFVTPVDLFRFSEDSVTFAAKSSSQSLIDWTTGRTDAQGQEVDKYFSIDGGQTKIASFSTGRRFGDGYQTSNWKAAEITGNYLGIFDPSPAPGQRLFITENDRRLLDVVGWNLDSAFWPTNPGSGGNFPPTGSNPPPMGGNPPPPTGGNPPPPTGGNPPPPTGGNPPPPTGGNPPPPTGGNPPPVTGGNPPPMAGNPPQPRPPVIGSNPPSSVAVPEAGHGLGAAVLVVCAVGYWLAGKSR
ncbi:MAG: NF038122 family metalloprotease [Leptolyngbyaceae cyanobacterium]